MKFAGVKMIIGFLSVVLVFEVASAAKICPHACAKVLNPVCAESGSNGARETFSNYCEFVRRQCEEPGYEWTLISEGPCSSY